MQRSRGGLRLFPRFLPQQRHSKGLSRHSPVLLTSGFPWFNTRVGGNTKTARNKEIQLPLSAQTPVENNVSVAGASTGPEATNTSTSDAGVR